MSVFPGDGPDTAFARALLDQGVEQGLLRATLDEVRRAGPGANLPSLLGARRLVAPETLARAAQALAGQAPRLAEAPAQLGPYRLLRELARGGMGAVYEAQHVETGGRVALKRILPELLLGLDAELLERFRREAQLSARLHHPAIVPVHAAELEGPAPYLVQAFLPGGSLAEQVERLGPLDPQVARALGVRLAEALAHAHAHGVVHRDLKPQNVLFDERGDAALTDFGLAAVRGQGLTLTQSGELLGSPAYMPPEQIQDARSADARSDVYALGAVLYFALAGQAPHRGQNVFEVLQRVLEVEPLPLAELAPQVPAPLRRTVERALAKAPERRFAGAEDLAAALREGDVSPPGRGLTGALAAALGVVLLGGLVALWGAPGSSLAPALTPAPPSAPSPRPTTGAREGPPSVGREREARLIAGVPLEALGELDPDSRRRLAALQAALEDRVADARALLPEAAPNEQMALDLIEECALLRTRWADPVPAFAEGRETGHGAVYWDWPERELLMERAARLPEHGLGHVAREATQRALAAYLLFADLEHFVPLGRRPEFELQSLALAADGLGALMVRTSLARRLDLWASDLDKQGQGRQAKLARGRQAALEGAVLTRTPPALRTLERLTPNEQFCLALRLSARADLEGSWRATGLALGERALGDFDDRRVFSMFSDMGALLRRNLMMRYREAAFSAFAGGGDGRPDLDRALGHARELRQFSDSLQAAITFLMAGELEEAARALREARQHKEREHKDPERPPPTADVDYLEAELALIRGDVEQAAGRLGQLLELGGEGEFTGAEDLSLPGEVFALQFHVHHRLERQPEQRLLFEAGRREALGIPWRTAKYTRRLVEAPETTWFPSPARR